MESNIYVTSPRGQDVTKIDFLGARKVAKRRQSLPKQEPVGPINVEEPLPYAPDFAERVRAMDFWLASHEGGPWYKASKDAQGEDVLVAVPGEDNRSLELRRRLATYRNYCRPIVGKYVGLVFGSGKVERDGENAKYKSFADDCDRLGNTLHDFMRQAMERACIEGVHYAIMESDKRDNASELDARTSETNMFLVDLDPRNVIDYSHRGHKLTQCLVSLGSNAARYYDEDVIFDIFLDDEGKVLYISEPYEHGYGDIPVVQFLSSDSGGSMLSDIAELNKAIFNLDSLHRTELQRQTFTTHFILGCESRDIETLVSGGRRFVAISKSNPISIETVGADISQAASLREAMKSDVDEIWRLAGLSNPDVVQNTESGRALRIKFDEISSKARMIADHAEKAENYISEMWRVGMSDMEVADAQYPETFTAEDVSVDVDIYGRLPDEPATLKRLMLSKIATELFPGMDEEDSGRLAIEIRQMDFSDKEESDENGQDKQEETKGDVR